MFELFVKILEQLNSSVFVLIVILIITIWLVFKLGKLIEQFSQHKTKIEKIDFLSDKLVELTVKVDLIYQNTNPNKTVAASSPAIMQPQARSAPDVPTKTIPFHVIGAAAIGAGIPSGSVRRVAQSCCPFSMLYATTNPSRNPRKR